MRRNPRNPADIAGSGRFVRPDARGTRAPRRESSRRREGQSLRHVPPAAFWESDTGGRGSSCSPSPRLICWRSSASSRSWRSTGNTKSLGLEAVSGERVLTPRQLNRALLARQLLLERRKLGVQQAVERLCAIQAQWPQSPYVALWSRLVDFRKEQLTRALAQHRVVKSQLFRITLHITSARDYPYFVAVWGPAARDRTPGVSKAKLEELTERVREAALKGPITQEQVEELASAEMGGFRWRTRTLTPLIHLPPGGTWSHYSRTELGAMETVLGVELPSREDAAERLVRSYLTAFGPATQEDLLRFAGVRVGDVRAGLERLELRRFRDERGRLLLDVPRAPLPDGDTPAPVRFLPKWDSSLLAYAPPERTRILPEKFRSTVIAKNGDVAPTVLVDGFVAATWSLDKKAGLQLTPLRRLSKLERSAIEAEGERLVEFVRG